MWQNGALYDSNGNVCSSLSKEDKIFVGAAAALCESSTDHSTVDQDTRLTSRYSHIGSDRLGLLDQVPTSATQGQP